jgi:hypothetical protein
MHIAPSRLSLLNLGCLPFNRPNPGQVDTTGARAKKMRARLEPIVP